MILFLLDMGANPNMVDQQGRMAVMRAAEYGHVQSLQVLAEANSDMTGNGNAFTLQTNTSIV